MGRVGRVDPTPEREGFRTCEKIQRLTAEHAEIAENPKVFLGGLGGLGG